jgi:deoxyribodipyrimidine photolyase-related protein
VRESDRRQDPIRNLVVILGDQLDSRSAALDGFDRTDDAAWMAEVPHESTKVRSHKARIALFLGAMRHFRDDLRWRGMRVEYRALEGPHAEPTLGEALAADLRRLRPQGVVLVQPGEWGVRREIERAIRGASLQPDVRPDRHFLCSPDEFARHAQGRKQLRMEFFYREMRRKTGVLVQDGKPVGDRWNFDADNRTSFGRDGPGDVPPLPTFRVDETLREVLRTVQARFPDHPGSLKGFSWPVTRRAALRMMRCFVADRLASFGPFQDAMWTGRPFLHHSLLSPALNLKLIQPREVIAAVEEAYHRGEVPLASAEGFIRQVLGWREYVRGIYWLHMPQYADLNALAAEAPLPLFYWTADTDMRCLREVIGQTLEWGYAHHIQRLMVTGLFALLLGVRPEEVHRWYLAVHVDAVEWVELPNVLGMSQFADGGLMASKPYVATGRYLRRMSNYCDGCRYRPDRASGRDACPFTTLYWDFLRRHRKTLSPIPRMKMQLRNLARKGSGEMRAIRRRAEKIHDGILP